MNKTFLQSILLIVILMMSISTQAQPLWGETTVGMTPSEVIEMVEGSRLIQDGNTLETGAKELARLDDLRVVKELFKVRFYFINDNLTQVTLNLNDEKSFPLSLLVFQSLTNALNSKYGEAISRNIDGRSILQTAEANWISNGMNINLQLMAVGDSPTSLNLNYQLHLNSQKKLSTEAEKL